MALTRNFLYTFGESVNKIVRTFGYTCVSERHLCSDILARSRALYKTRYPSENMPRFASSCEKQSEVDPFGLVQDDLKMFYHGIRETLGENISNKEMHKIASHIYLGQEGHNGVWVTLPILVGKALNTHMHGDGTLTDSQRKVVVISDLLMTSLILHDDVLDNSKLRRGIPSANVVWYPYKSTVVGNMIYAICLNEACKLNNPDITISVSEIYENFCRGQYMQCKDSQGKDRLTYYLEKTNYKAGGAFACGLKAMAQAVGANEMLTEVVTKYAQNVCNVGQLIDDLVDFKSDLQEGVATAPVIFASKEHPVLEEMMSRNFQQEGDVQKAVELVDQSRGLQEAKDLAGRYCADALRNAKLLVASPYQEMLEAIVHYYMYRLEYDMDKIEHDDHVY